MIEHENGKGTLVCVDEDPGIRLEDSRLREGPDYLIDDADETSVKEPNGPTRLYERHNTKAWMKGKSPSCGRRLDHEQQIWI